MAIHVALYHKTEYTYDRPVSLSPQIIRLRPAPHCRTPILSYSLTLTPEKHFVNWQQDPQSNYLARLLVPEKTRKFSIEVDLVAEMSVFNPFDFFLEPSAEQCPFQYEPWLTKELASFMEVQAPGPLLRKYLATVDRTKRRTIDFIVGLNRLLASDIGYVIRLEPGVQTPEETLTLRKGSCRDTGWLLVQVLRHLGLAARFVSGYLIQLVPDVKPLEGPAGPPVDFTDLHAWAEVYLPGAGWVGLDPTSGLLAGHGHIPLAATPDPFSAAPVTGAVDECKVEFSHEMRVRRIYESPRVTKPYTDAQWQQIESLGHAIDTELSRADVRLTMGGEPTFVSIDDMEGAEWNVAALGPKKRELGGTLIRRLKARYAPGGLLHYGQGKWYPGESLPRWALGCWWRRDGVPIWHDDTLIADESVDYGHGEREAACLIAAVAKSLDVDPRHAMPAYEDIWHYLWQERRLPTNLDPLKSDLKNAEERARLAQVFERGLDRIVGYVLPVERARSANGGAEWFSGQWAFRSEHLFLIPGDSPIGYRLPLDSLEWVAPEERSELFPIDPFAPRPPIPAPRPPLPSVETAQQRPPSHGDGATPSRRQIAPQAPGPGTSSPKESPFRGVRLQPGLENPPEEPVKKSDMSKLGSDAEFITSHRIQRVTPNSQPDFFTGSSGGSHDDSFLGSAPSVIRTALCVEPRLGRLHVFMPPVRNTEDYLNLVSAVEQAAKASRMPVVIEGETPPSDTRLNHIKVTPDPGVIEVNLHPAHSWDELVTQTTTLYEEARLSRLGTEKFMLDGRHTGTGGGNHIVIGGPTAADSPILRRPDVLRSLLAYWHNHPSLSFLFSGLFIGPTSQHPRVDEARNDSVHELEIAFAQIPDGTTCPPWLVDRVFRHILADVTGNTHRTEFCIDKLYAPETSSGRQGLVELRAFEMPPHARMSLTQQLLLRALIAWLWKAPYSHRIVRWSTELHDRFMLPHFVAQDFHDVIADLQRGGYALQTEWFSPHLEFRFPLYGAIARRGVHVELRQALEPWHVMGEEPGAGGAVRYVDSSVERLQVKVTGMTGSRHVVACNGRQVPLHPTGPLGEFVAGVRYRAWQPPSCLHPTIPVHAPLVFDVIDQWNQSSIGGCVYHVAHPGGRNFETLPVNAFEAESRRLARFADIGHTPGSIDVPPEETNPDFPLTLDLRRPHKHSA